MAWDAAVTYKRGEKRYVYATATASSGTLTLASSTYKVYDNSGTLGANGNATPVIVGPAATIEAAYLMDTTSLTDSGYRVAFTLTDTNGIIYRPEILVQIEDVP